MPGGTGGRRARGPCHQPLAVVAVGSVAPNVAERAASVCREVLGFSSRHASACLDPVPFFDPRRRQYRADQILAGLKTLAVQPHEVVLGLTDCDLFLPILTFVFGCAELAGNAAVVSVHRLDPRFYGEEPDPGLILERTEKEVLHELGHVLGLTHCRDRRCVMAGAHEVGMVDLEDPVFCANCRRTMFGCPQGDDDRRLPWSKP